MIAKLPPSKQCRLHYSELDLIAGSQGVTIKSSAVAFQFIDKYDCHLVVKS